MALKSIAANQYQFDFALNIGEWLRLGIMERKKAIKKIPVSILIFTF